MNTIRIDLNSTERTLSGIREAIRIAVSAGIGQLVTQSDVDSWMLAGCVKVRLCQLGVENRDRDLFFPCPTETLLHVGSRWIDVQHKEG